ncbi:MAG: hypothetical protein ABIT37_04420 [Luteolibacter sp.]
MKKIKKSVYFLWVVIISSLIAVVLTWIGLLIWSAEFGARKEIIKQFPTAKLYPENAPNLGLVGLLQALMPEGFVLPGIRADVVIEANGTKVSFRDLQKLKIGYFRVSGCKIEDWENLINNKYGNMYILITDTEFIGGDIKSRERLESYKKEDLADGVTCYSFGNAP